MEREEYERENKRQNVSSIENTSDKESSLKCVNNDIYDNHVDVSYNFSKFDDNEMIKLTFEPDESLTTNSQNSNRSISRFFLKKATRK